MASLKRAQPNLQAKAYLRQRRVPPLFEQMLTALVCKTPKNHLDFLIDYLVVVRELGRDFASDSTVTLPWAHVVALMPEHPGGSALPPMKQAAKSPTSPQPRLLGTTALPAITRAAPARNDVSVVWPAELDPHSAGTAPAGSPTPSESNSIVVEPSTTMHLVDRIILESVDETAPIAVLPPHTVGTLGSAARISAPRVSIGEAESGSIRPTRNKQGGVEIQPMSRASQSRGEPDTNHLFIPSVPHFEPHARIHHRGSEGEGARSRDSSDLAVRNNQRINPHQHPHECSETLASAPFAKLGPKGSALNGGNRSSSGPVDASTDTACVPSRQSASVAEYPPRPSTAE